MGLYLGKSNKLTITVNNAKHYIKIPDIVSLIEGTMLLDKRGYILKDSNGIYLLEKESE